MATQPATDLVDALYCGQAELKQFLQRQAFVNQKADSAQTYVCCRGDVVNGFDSLGVGSVNPYVVPSRVMKGLARHPVPVMLLARLRQTGSMSAKARDGPFSRMRCCVPPRPPTSLAFAVFWFMPGTIPAASGTKLGNSSPAPLIRTICFRCSNIARACCAEWCLHLKARLAPDAFDAMSAEARTGDCLGQRFHPLGTRKSHSERPAPGQRSTNSC